MAALEPYGLGAGFQPRAGQGLGGSVADGLRGQSGEGRVLAPVGTHHPAAHGQQVRGHEPEVPPVMEAHAGSGREDGIPDAEGRREVAQGGAEAAEGVCLQGAEADLHAPAPREVGGERLQPPHGIHGRRVGP